MSEVKYIPGEVIVKWRAGVEPVKRHRVKRKHFLLDRETGPHWQRDGITHHHGVEHGRERETADRLMAENPEVEWAEPNGIMTIDPVLTQRSEDVETAEGSANFVASANDWWLGQVGAIVAATGIGKLDEIWAAGIDSGYRHAEPFFAGCVANEKNFVTTITSTGIAPDSTEDHEGHGTATLAIALEALKLFTDRPRVNVGRVMSANSASWSNVSQGVLWLLDLVPLSPVIWCSIGGGSDSFSLKDAALQCQAKGVAWICAAGNSSSTTPQYPANTAGAYAIAATKEPFFDGTVWREERASFTNTGPWIDGSFPGTNFRCPKLDGTDGIFNGTSASAPGFGACVAIVAKYFKISGVEAVNRILAACKKLADAGLGAGRADLAAALGMPSQEPSPGPTPPPAPLPSPPPPAGVPAVPANVRATNITTKSFIVEWDPVPGATRYEAWRGDFRFEGAKAPTTSVLFPWGEPDKEYKIRVLAANDAGASALSEPIYVRTLASGNPAPPPPPPPPPAPVNAFESSVATIEAGWPKADDFTKSDTKQRINALG